MTDPDLDPDLDTPSTTQIGLNDLCGNVHSPVAAGGLLLAIADGGIGSLDLVLQYVPWSGNKVGVNRLHQGHLDGLKASFSTEKFKS